MGKLVVSTFVTLDGVMEGNGSPSENHEGFRHGGWQMPYLDEDTARIMLEQFAGIESFLLGRRTYEIFASHWPRVTDENDPIAAKLNGAPKYVASRTLDAVEWSNARLLRGDVATAVADLKGRSAGEINVQGSGNLIRTLQEHDLVDEHRLLIHPVVLGAGQRLFADGAVPAALTLTSTRTTGSGVMYCTYRYAGTPTYGSLEMDNYPEKAREVGITKG